MLATEKMECMRISGTSPAMTQGEDLPGLIHGNAIALQLLSGPGKLGPWATYRVHETVKEMAEAIFCWFARVKGTKLCSPAAMRLALQPPRGHLQSMIADRTSSSIFWEGGGEAI